MAPACYVVEVWGIVAFYRSRLKNKAGDVMCRARPAFSREAGVGERITAGGSGIPRHVSWRYNSTVQ